MNHVDLTKIDDSHVRDQVAKYVPFLNIDGVIDSPGKFEREPLWTVYFYEIMLNGDGEDFYASCDEHKDCGDEQCEHEHDCDCELELEYTKFDVQAGDAEAFPDLEDSIGKELRLREDSQGFVYAWLVQS